MIADSAKPGAPEETLREDLERFRRMATAAFEGIGFSEAGRILDVNEQLARMFGFAPAEMIGRPLLDMVAPESRVQVQARLLSDREDAYEHKCLRKDGSTFVVESRGRHLWVGGRRLRVTAVRDVTARHEAEAARREIEELYRTLVNASPDGISVLDLDGRVRFASPRAAEIFGSSGPEESLGRSGLDSVAPADRARAAELLQAVLGGQRQTARLSLLRQDGSTFAGEVSAAVLRDEAGRPRGLILVTRDVTEHKRHEDELRRKNEELERFTYTVSHDLKSPLITIKGFAGAMLQDLAQGRHERLATDLQRISVAADKMSELLNDLLELSRVGRIVHRPCDVDMDQLVRDVLELLAGPIGQRQARLVVHPGLPSVRGDRQRLLEVLQNLVENALKFCQDGVRPQIEIGIRDLPDGPAFFVRDQGLGIEPLYQETVFGLFNKLDTRSEGTGIGLALVRRIIDFHGGRIWLESAGLGCGTTFLFTLPLCAKPSPPSAL